MQLYHALPSTNYRWTTSPIDSIRCLRSPKQGVLNQVVLARMELIRLIAFSAGECAIHLAAAAAKLTAAVMQLPLYPIFGGVTARVALFDAGSHAAYAIKLTIAIPCVPVLGLAQPEWSISLYQRLALVKGPTGIGAAAFDAIRNAAKAAWASSYRNDVLFGMALAGAALIGNRVIRPWKAASAVGSFPPMLWGLSALALGSVCGALRLMTKRKSPKSPSDEPLTIETIPSTQLLQPLDRLDPKSLVAIPWVWATGKISNITVKLLQGARHTYLRPSLPVRAHPNLGRFASMDMKVITEVMLPFLSARDVGRFRESHKSFALVLQNFNWEKLCPFALPRDPDETSKLVKMSQHEAWIMSEANFFSGMFSNFGDFHKPEQFTRDDFKKAIEDLHLDAQATTTAWRQLCYLYEHSEEPWTWIFNPELKPSCVTFLQDGRVAVGHSDGRVCIWNKDGTKLNFTVERVELNINSGNFNPIIPVTHIIVLPDGNIAVGAYEHASNLEVYVFQPDGSRVSAFGLWINGDNGRGKLCMTSLLDGRIVVGDSGGMIRVLNLNGIESASLWPRETFFLRSIQVLKDGTLVMHAKNKTTSTWRSEYLCGKHKIYSNNYFCITTTITPIGTR